MPGAGVSRCLPGDGYQTAAFQLVQTHPTRTCCATCETYAMQYYDFQLSFRVTVSVIPHKKCLPKNQLDFFCFSAAVLLRKYIELSVCILVVSCIVAPKIFSYSWYSAVCACINRYSLMITSSLTGKQPSEGNQKNQCCHDENLSSIPRKAFFFSFNLFFLHFASASLRKLFPCSAQERSASGPFLSRQGGGSREKFIESLWG